MKQIAVFASGSGSNAENLALYFKGHPDIHISMMVCDRKNAFVFERMKKLGVPAYYLTADALHSGELVKVLREHKIDFIVLAGFLKLIPQNLLDAYPGKIINIHPALLPAYGGKGMYGMHVHNAVVNAKESKTGITIHYVNSEFDEGEVIAQYETEVSKSDTAESVASKIHELEMKYYPEVVEKLLMDSDGQ